MSGPARLDPMDVADPEVRAFVQELTALCASRGMELNGLFSIGPAEGPEDATTVNFAGISSAGPTFYGLHTGRR